MSSNEPANTGRKPRSDAWKTALTVLQTAEPPSIPAGAEVMTILVEFPQEIGHSSAPAFGAAFGYVLEGRCSSSSKVSRSV